MGRGGFRYLGASIKGVADKEVKVGEGEEEKRVYHQEDGHSPYSHLLRCNAPKYAQAMSKNRNIATLSVAQQLWDYPLH